MKLFRWVILLVFWMGWLKNFSQTSANKRDSLGFYSDEFIVRINTDKDFHLEDSRFYIKKHEIKEYLLRELDLYISKIENQEAKCQVYVALAYNFSSNGSYKDAQSLLLKALAIAEKNKITRYQTCVYNVMGNIFGETSMFESAIQNYYRGLKIAIETKDSSTICTLQLNLGTTYYKFTVANKTYEDSARIHIEVAIKLAEKLTKQEDLNRAYQCLGLIETDNDDFKKAELAFRKSIEVCIVISDSTALSYGYYQLARMFIEKDGIAEADSAIFYLGLADAIAKKSNDLELASEVVYELARAYSNNGDYKLSSYYALRFSELNDSLVRLENMRATAELSEKYESVKKEAQITELNLSQKEKQAQIDRQVYMIIGSVIVLVFVGFAAFSLYRSNQIRKKANFELSEKNNLIEAQKREVEQKNDLIETKNKEILDSIHYAKRIQDSLLPTEKYLERNIKKLKKGDNKRV